MIITIVVRWSNRSGTILSKSLGTRIVYLPILAGICLTTEERHKWFSNHIAILGPQSCRLVKILFNEVSGTEFSPQALTLEETLECLGVHLLDRLKLTIRTEQRGTQVTSLCAEVCIRLENNLDVRLASLRIV